MDEHDEVNVGASPMDDHHHDHDDIEEEEEDEEEDEQPTIIMPIEVFAHDLETKLGRANGNVYVRHHGAEGLHDGQIMVRLKKKRFIIIDYSILPNNADIAAAAGTPHVLVPAGAGKQKCVSQDCTKVGVPVMLFDSDPEQPLSLYLRSGLCFTCQRLLNEKRRTQRKRKIDPNNPPVHAMDGSMNLPPGSSEHYSMESINKRFRLDGEILDLNPDAIIINGPLDDTKHHQPGYEYPEIGIDLQKITSEVSQDTLELINTVSSMNEMPHPASEENAHILGMYEKTFVSISKGIFLLNQWRTSWDTTIANAGNEHALDGSGIGDAVATADVVASAAAVAAAQSISEDQSSNNMIPMLLAGGNDKQDENDETINDEKPEIFGV